MSTKILIIDDEVDLVEMLGFKLRSNGYNVVKAHTSEEGIKIALREKPDLVLLNLLMPDVEGFEVLKKLKTNKETAAISIIVTSEKITTEDKIKASQNYSDNYIVKPFESEVLMLAINSTLAEKGTMLIRTSYNGPERRAHPRREITLQVAYTLPEDVKDKKMNLTKAYSKDLSESGLCIYTNDLFPPQTVIYLLINLPTKREIIVVNGKIKWCKENAPEAYRKYLMGVSFIDLKEEDKAAIRGIIT